jgi:hypothetical protein
MNRAARIRTVGGSSNRSDKRTHASRIDAYRAGIEQIGRRRSKIAHRAVFRDKLHVRRTHAQERRPKSAPRKNKFLRYPKIVMSGECCCESARRLQLRTFVTLMDYIVDDARNAGLRVSVESIDGLWKIRTGRSMKILNVRAQFLRYPLTPLLTAVVRPNNRLQGHADCQHR